MDTKCGLKTAVTVTFTGLWNKTLERGRKKERFLAMNRSWKDET
jgi:hypothetical protein